MKQELSIFDHIRASDMEHLTFEKYNKCGSYLVSLIQLPENQTSKS